jgi:DNA-binding NtrC family response regulator
LVRGVRVNSVVLQPGDVIRAGETVLVYGDPDPMAAIRDRVTRVAPADLTVLLLGETGTGKERLARSLHDQSGRSGPLVAINCAAVPKELLAAELFGHTRGAFSGATDARRGLFQTAQHGTLLLDEIGDVPLELQTVLLRTLQEGTVRPLGADAEVKTDVRVVAATHASLEQAVQKKQFRADLYARLAHTVIRVPPLRERRADILALAAEFARTSGAQEWSVTADAAEALVRYDWPFNVRELEALVRAFLAMRDGPTLGLSYLEVHHPNVVENFLANGEATSVAPAAPLAEKPLRNRAAVEALLARHQGNVSIVAEQLGKPRAQVYRWIKVHGLDPKRFRQ